MARKGQRIEGFREQDIAAIKGGFQYYSADMHRGAFAMPAFFYREVAG
jgi:spermidine synthase